MNRLVRAALFALPLIASAGQARAKVDIVVDLSAQTLVATRGDGTRVEWPVSTGRAGFETPGGEYQVQRLDYSHHSKKYDDAPMPYAIFFSGGYAIHGTFQRGLGKPASHGCVRLSLANAALLYDWVDVEGAQIRIQGKQPASRAVVARRAPSGTGFDRAVRRDVDREDAYYAGGFPAYAGVPPYRRRLPPAPEGSFLPSSPSEYYSSGD